MTTKKTLSPKAYKRIGLLFPEVLQYYGYGPGDAFRWDDQQLRLPCPVHKGDNKTAFVWSCQFLTWHCFSHRCHDVHGNDALAFIMAMEDCTREEAREIANQIVEANKDVAIERRQEMRRNYKRTTHNSQKKLDMDPQKVMFSSYATSRGIPAHVQQKYLVGTHSVAGLHRFSVPIFDIHGRVVGLSARKVIESDSGPKWLHLPIGFKSNVNLYNIHAVKPKKGAIILVEGPLDVLRFESANIHHSMATLGSSISQEQILLLGNLKIENVIIAYDNDKAGESGARKAAKLLRDHEYNVLRMRWSTRYNDIGEIPIYSLRRNQWQLTEDI
jgi:5S rRNA maturation endonuclease (ribonuclease M5)